MFGRARFISRMKAIKDGGKKINRRDTDEKL
jgi:hypothetical protein